MSILEGWPVCLLINMYAGRKAILFVDKYADHPPNI
jgi:hypothetical protein